MQIAGIVGSRMRTRTHGDARGGGRRGDRARELYLFLSVGGGRGGHTRTHHRYSVSGRESLGEFPQTGLFVGAAVRSPLAGERGWRERQLGERAAARGVVVHPHKAEGRCPWATMGSILILQLG